MVGGCHAGVEERILGDWTGGFRCLSYSEFAVASVGAGRGPLSGGAQIPGLRRGVSPR